MATKNSLTTPAGLCPLVKCDERVVLYDGVCKLCNGWAQFLIRFDQRHHFKLVAAQSVEGQILLRWYGMPTEHYETMLLVEGEQLYQRSTAFIRVVAGLGLPWNLAAAAWLIPAPLRNWLYDRIALNRYALFGRHDQCPLLVADHEERFLHH
jgi:predicted DCC family thiol-disulfide oxidoreductase YuxK